MGRKSDATKLLAIGLLNVADDEGYFYADAKLIRNAIRPFDDDSGITTVSIRELSEIGYISIRNHPTHGDIGKVISFAEHQVINKPKRSKLKELHESGINTVSIPDEARPEGKGKEQGKEGNGRERKEQLSPPFSSDQFKVAWDGWTKYKSERRQKLTPSTIVGTFRKFAKWGEAKSIEAIERSIANGWQGLFEPDEKPSGGKHAGTTAMQFTGEEF